MAFDWKAAEAAQFKCPKNSTETRHTRGDEGGRMCYSAHEELENQRRPAVYSQTYWPVECRTRYVALLRATQRVGQYAPQTTGTRLQVEPRCGSLHCSALTVCSVVFLRPCSSSCRYTNR